MNCKVALQRKQLRNKDRLSLAKFVLQILTMDGMMYRTDCGSAFIIKRGNDMLQKVTVGWTQNRWCCMEKNWV